MAFINQFTKAKSSMISFAKKVALTSALILGFAQISHAALIQGTDENLTIDTSTGLIWLDVDFTTNLSWNQMQTLLLTGGTFQNFQLATTA
ncbi:MAG: hypothetical protein KBE16_02585 [Alphaproteobacteria bacterium]|jgi:hypothetical protein|nr:hypothetical protein [Alphaproteobacteria bacterium]MBP9877271.1 hypothetical protein [Alphaproteobacteria bacterium]